MSTHVDFLGKPIKVGDTVVWADAGGRGGSMGLNKSTVKRMTEKQCLLEESRWGKTWRPFNCVVVTEVSDE